MILSLIAISIACFVLGALLEYCLMERVLRTDRDDHREMYADAVVRRKNAESVANKYAAMNNEQRSLFMKHGSVHCSRCGKFSKYADSYLDANADAFLCKSCANKSLGKKDVQHV